MMRRKEYRRGGITALECGNQAAAEKEASRSREARLMQRC